MDQTLYLSDLDGTLLGADGEVSEYTRQVIQDFVEIGGLFSIATARSPQMAAPTMKALDLKLPVLLNNGAITYDPLKEEFLEVVTIHLETVEKLYRVFTQYQITGFMYIMENNTIKLAYEKLRGEEDHHYYDRRYQAYEGSVYRCASILEMARYYSPIFFVVYGTPLRLNDVHKELLSIPGISCSLYEDTYSQGKYYYIDIFSNKASKGIGMARLQRLVGADRVAAFGDNFNDLEMLQAADEAYVPANGVTAAKKIAVQVLEPCDQDGVAKFLANLL